MKKLLFSCLFALAPTHALAWEYVEKTDPITDATEVSVLQKSNDKSSYVSIICSRGPGKLGNAGFLLTTANSYIELPPSRRFLPMVVRVDRNKPFNVKVFALNVGGLLGYYVPVSGVEGSPELIDKSRQAKERIAIGIGSARHLFPIEGLVLGLNKMEKICGDH